MHGHLPLDLPDDLRQPHPLGPLLDGLDLALRIPPMLIGPPCVCAQAGSWVIVDVRAWPSPEDGLAFEAVAPDEIEVLVDPFRPEGEEAGVGPV